MQGAEIRQGVGKGQRQVPKPVGFGVSHCKEFELST